MQRVIEPVKPGVAESWKAVVPGGFWWAPVAVRFSMEAKAEAATQEAALKLITGGNLNVMEIPTGLTTAAGFTYKYNFLRGGSSLIAENKLRAITGMPAFIMEPGWTLEVEVTSSFSHLQFASPVLLVEQFEPYQEHDIDYLRDMAHRLEAIEEALTHGASTS